MRNPHVSKGCFREQNINGMYICSSEHSLTWYSSLHRSNKLSWRNRPFSFGMAHCYMLEHQFVQSHNINIATNHWIIIIIIILLTICLPYECMCKLSFPIVVSSLSYLFIEHYIGWQMRPARTSCPFIFTKGSPICIIPTHLFLSR